ncbi:MAG: hypothetical protein AAFY08_16345, partial [Planctomycetota bacterium]
MSQDALSEILVAFQRVMHDAMANTAGVNPADPVRVGYWPDNDLHNATGAVAQVIIDGEVNSIEGDTKDQYTVPVSTAIIARLDLTSPSSQPSGLLALNAAWFTVRRAIKRAYARRATEANPFTPFAPLKIGGATRLTYGRHDQLADFSSMASTWTVTFAADPDTDRAVKQPGGGGGG